MGPLSLLFYFLPFSIGLTEVELINILTEVNDIVTVIVIFIDWWKVEVCIGWGYALPDDTLFITIIFLGIYFIRIVGIVVHSRDE